MKLGSIYNSGFRVELLVRQETMEVANGKLYHSVPFHPCQPAPPASLLLEPIYVSRCDARLVSMPFR